MRTDSPTARRLLVIGLDSVPPDFLFDRCLAVMPNVRRLLGAGVSAPLRTTDPPITIPAWPVMFTGVDPGTLGFYGFRHRANSAYFRTYTPTTGLLPVPTLWQLLSDRGRRVCVIGMPPSYPAPPLNGICISDFLAPPNASDVTYPPELRAELERRYGPYRSDVVFRADERDNLFREIVEMTDQRFSIAEELYQRERWDFFAIHEIGTDRLHHAYTKYFDPAHRAYIPGNRFERTAEQYYARVDERIGRLISLADENTLVFLASDHGSMPMTGCFCINQWLIEKGYLALRSPVAPATPLEKADVDWSRTRVWGAGGYYARLFFNVKGREPSGILAPKELEATRERLLRDLSQLRQPNGTPLSTRVLDPRRIYRFVRGDPPDLMVYFDDLRWRSAGTIGYPTPYLDENDTGPDDAVHGFEGVFVLYDPRVRDGRRLPTLNSINVAPTLLELLDEEVPAHMQGRAMAEVRPVPAARGDVTAPTPPASTAPQAT
jgi:predicted AlkP superfamily phosphohydrolase/phosphomutase